MADALNLSIEEVKDAIQATILWEREFDDEIDHNERMMTADFTLPQEMPDEAREACEEWIKKMRKNSRERMSKLKNLLPDRQEAATLLRGKFISYKRQLMNELSDQLGNG